jgi:hypothetical protein
MSGLCRGNNSTTAATGQPTCSDLSRTPEVGQLGGAGGRLAVVGLDVLVAELTAVVADGPLVLTASLVVASVVVVAVVP